MPLNMLKLFYGIGLAKISVIWATLCWYLLETIHWTNVSNCLLPLTMPVAGNVGVVVSGAATPV